LIYYVFHEIGCFKKHEKRENGVLYRFVCHNFLKIIWPNQKSDIIDWGLLQANQIAIPLVRSPPGLGAGWARAGLGSGQGPKRALDQSDTKAPPPEPGPPKQALQSLGTGKGQNRPSPEPGPPKWAS